MDKKSFKDELCHWHGITNEKFEQVRKNIQKDCFRRNDCSLIDIPECCSIFKERLSDILLDEKHQMNCHELKLSD